jgi:glycosyltransferase involved in cell wall biosynthesis
MEGDENYLLVGRLIPGKDPFTILKAFESYVTVAPDAHLYVVFQNDDLLEEVKSIISASPLLKTNVHLVGKLLHEQLPYWYSAADYYLSASHWEAAGYALIEAMACGCIPVVSDIPPFQTLTNNGEAGFHFRKGDADDLFRALCGLKHVDKQALSEKIMAHFHSNLSFKSIAHKIAAIIEDLTSHR